MKISELKVGKKAKFVADHALSLLESNIQGGTVVIDFVPKCMEPPYFVVVHLVGKEECFLARIEDLHPIPKERETLECYLSKKVKKGEDHTVSLNGTDYVVIQKDRYNRLKVEARLYRDLIGTLSRTCKDFRDAAPCEEAKQK